MKTATVNLLIGDIVDQRHMYADVEGVIDDKLSHMFSVDDLAGLLNGTIASMSREDASTFVRTFVKDTVTSFTNYTSGWGYEVVGYTANIYLPIFSDWESWSESL